MSRVALFFRRLWCWLRYRHRVTAMVTEIRLGDDTFEPDRIYLGDGHMSVTDAIWFAPGMKVRIGGLTCSRCGARAKGTP